MHVEYGPLFSLKLVCNRIKISHCLSFCIHFVLDMFVSSSVDEAFVQASQTSPSTWAKVHSLFLDVTLELHKGNSIGTIAQAHFERVLKNKPAKTTNKITNLPLQNKTKQAQNSQPSKHPTKPYWDVFITLTQWITEWLSYKGSCNVVLSWIEWNFPEQVTSDPVWSLLCSDTMIRCYWLS